MIIDYCIDGNAIEQYIKSFSPSIINTQFSRITRYIETQTQYYDIPSSITDLLFANGFGSTLYQSLSFPSFENLTTIEFGEESFSEVATLSISGLNKLQSLIFHKNSFTLSKNSYAERTNRQLTIKNCPELTTISFGDYSFSDYHSIQLQNLNSLASVTFGRYCFYFSSFSFSCMIIGCSNEYNYWIALPSLIQFDLGHDAFTYAEVINLSGFNSINWVIVLDLPAFEVLNMNDYALEGDGSSNRYSTSYYVNSYSNTITLKSNY